MIKTPEIKNYHNKALMWIKTSVWAFPVVLAIVLLGLSALKISGSSVGVYYETLYGNESKDPDLIYGEPRQIRSDEWLLQTQSVVIQSHNNYENFNENIRDGVDLSKSSSTPTNDWVNIFRPHNWSFLFLPLEQAFSFSWWLPIYLLVTSCYFFVLRIFKRKKLFAILISLAFALSPFVLWWYLTPIVLTLAYGFLITILALRVLSQESIPRIKSRLITNILYVIGLVFLGTSLGLLLYPPYSVPVMVVVAVFLLGHIIQKLAKKDISPVDLLKRLSVFAVSAILVLGIGLLFVIDHGDVINRVAKSEYPGKRISSSGELKLPQVFDGYLMPLLQGEFRGKNYHSNQSEASNFILLLPFLIIPAIVLQIIEYRKKRQIDYLLLLLNATGIMFLARGFLPFGNELYNLILFDRVPGVRMISGVGFLGLIHLLFLLKKLDYLKIPIKTLFRYSGAYALLCFSILLWLGFWVGDKYPDFVSETYVMVALALWFTSIIFAFLMNKKMIGAFLFFTFAIFSSFKIMPLYRGLDFFEDSEIVHSIQKVSNPEDRWITADNLYYLSLPAVAGQKLVNGNQPYGDLDYWGSLDKDGKYQRIYNRQARALFITGNPDMKPFELVQPNYFHIKFECSDFVYEKVDFVLSTNQIKYKCANLAKKVAYPKQTFYIYEIIDK